MKLKMPGGMNIADARQKEGDANKGFKKAGAGSATLRPSGKSRKNLLKKG